MNAPMKTRPLNLLFATWEGGGSVPPVLTAAEKMIARGHRVRIMSEACNRPEVEAVGARFVGWTRAPSRPDKSRDNDVTRDWEAVGPEGFVRLVETIMSGPALAYARDLRDELEREPADLVISSEMLLGVLAGCEAMGQPAVVLTTQIWAFPIAGAPPFGAGMPPAADEAGRAALAEVQGFVRSLFDRGLPALNAARAELGLGPLETVSDQLGAARALLVGTSEAFDFPWTDRPATVRYVGPQISDPPWAGDWTSPWAEDDPRPLVLVGFSSTFQDHVALLQRVLDALSGLDVRVVLTTGEAVTPGELSAPANAVVVRRAPHVRIMRQASLVATHGGHGTVIRALAQGLPQLVIPLGRDQNDNATRVAARGAGLRLDASASTDEIRAAARRLLDDPAFAEAARRLGRVIAEDAAAPTLEEELEAVAVSAVAVTPA